MDHVTAARADAWPVYAGALGGCATGWPPLPQGVAPGLGVD